MEQKRDVITSFEKFLASLTLGSAEAFENFTIFPVYTGRPQENGYYLLDEAVKTGKFKVTEVDEGGSVPHLKVTNDLDFDVLLLDGDILVGAKQNRSCTTTIIIGRRTSTNISVNCVERGRWAYKGKHFSSSDDPVYAKLRAVKARSVNCSLKEKQGFVADQGAVWSDISAKSISFSRCSPDFQESRTEAADDLYASNKNRLQDYEKAFALRDGQVGFIALIDGKIAGGDIFGNPRVLAKIYGKSLRSYILDAIEQALEKKKPVAAEGDLKRKASMFLGSIRKLKPEAYEAQGKGSNIRFEGKTSVGFAALNGDQVVHMAAFKQDAVTAKNQGDDTDVW